MKKKKSVKSSNVKIGTESAGEFLSKTKNVKIAYGVSIAIVIIILVIFYKPYVVDRLEPGEGVDQLASIAQTKQIIEWQKQSKEKALWNPSIFCGVPIYYAIPPSSFNIDVLIGLLNKVIDWRLGWLIVGLVGCFWMFAELGFPWYFAILGSLAFLFYPHFQALLTVGHFAKFRAVMAMPVVVAAFLRLAKKLDLLSGLVFSLAFALLLRTQHYQITFYCLLLLLALGISYIIQWVRNKEWSRLGRALGFVFLAFFLAVLMSARPLFLANEYTPYSTRGGQEINLKDEQSTAAKSGGVSFEYATRWSFSIREYMTLIIPRFYGGTSDEIYMGKAFPQYRGYRVPLYWGDLPFTQSSEYVGVIVVILAIIGFWYYKKDLTVQCLLGLLVFSILLSLGSNFSVLYKLLYYYLPYFSKFRVPMMILILIDLILVIMALYGIRAMIEKGKENWKPIVGVAGFFILIALFFLIFPDVLSYSSPQDASYAAKPFVITLFKNMRKEVMQADTLRMLALAILFMTLFLGYKFHKVSQYVLAGVLTILVGYDVIGVSYRFISNVPFKDPKLLEKEYFRPTRFDRVLQEDQEKFRILALGNLFQSNDLAYRYELVGGYSPIKPQLIQDIIDNNLFNLPDGRIINWSVVNMTNARYLLVPGYLDAENLTILEVDTTRRLVLYLNEDALPRAYFVKRIKVLPNEREVVNFLNNPHFNPGELALVSNHSLDSNKVYNSEGSIEIEEYTPNRVKISVETEDFSFLVLADAYYPVGWKALIDGKETPIYQVNHILRGIEVLQGEHKVEFIFAPKSYRIADITAHITSAGTWLTLIILLALKANFSCPIKAAIFKRKGRIKP